jgi:Secretion system C-terminal sorting domain
MKTAGWMGVLFLVLSVLGCKRKAAEPEVMPVFEIFPNPVADKLNIRYRSATDKPVQFVIYNMLGKEMERMIPLRNEAEIWEGKLKTAFYPVGAYVLVVLDEGSRESKKFVKE